MAVLILFVERITKNAPIENINKCMRIPKGNQKWTIQRNWQHRVHKTKKNKTKMQHNMF